ncbi:unnamed protein product [Lampetra fluviatilis]
MGEQPLGFELEVPFPSAREARIACAALSVDPEPRGRGVSRVEELRLGGATLGVRWSAAEARILRVSVSSYLDHLGLVLRTMDAFGPPQPGSAQNNSA